MSEIEERIGKSSQSREIVSRRDVERMTFTEALDFYTPNFVAALPPEISVDHFRRMLITAVNLNPKLATANRRTLLNEAVKCASDGLLPDGREAVLNIYGGDVVYQPMVDGIIKRMRNTGEIFSIVAEVVYKKDKFRYTKGSNPIIEHEPAGLEEDDPGPMIGAYCIIRLKNGQEISDVLRGKEVLAAKAQSKSPASLMWTKFEWEGWKKTALRRCSKRAPQSSTAADFEQLTRLLGHDEEDSPGQLPSREPPPRPRLAEYLAPSDTTADGKIATEHETTVPDREDRYFVIDLDGVEHGYVEPKLAVEMLEETLRQARQRDSKTVYAMWRDNEALRMQLEQDQEEALLTRLAACYKDNLTSLPNTETSASPTLGSPPRSPLGSTPGAGDEGAEPAMTTLKRELAKCKTRAECAAMANKYSKEIGALVAPDFEEWERHYKQDFERKP